MIVGTGDWKGLRTCVVREDTFVQDCLRAFFSLFGIFCQVLIFFQDAANSVAEHFSAKDSGKVPFYALNFQ